jgi:hypothetical protein
MKRTAMEGGRGWRERERREGEVENQEGGRGRESGREGGRERQGMKPTAMKGGGRKNRSETEVGIRPLLGREGEAAWQGMKRTAMKGEGRKNRSETEAEN